MEKGLQLLQMVINDKEVLRTGKFTGWESKPKKTATLTLGSGSKVEKQVGYFKNGLFHGTGIHQGADRQAYFGK